MITILFGLGSALGYALYSLVMLRVSRAAGAIGGLFTMMCVSTVLLTVLALGLDGIPAGAAQWRAVGLAALGGIFYTLCLASQLHGYAVGTLSVVAPLVALEGAGAALIAVGLGESLPGVAAIALPLAAMGTLLASLVPAAEGQETEVEVSGAPADGDGGQIAVTIVRPRARWTAGAGWGLLAALLSAVMLVLYGYTGAVSQVTASAAGHLAGTAVLVPYVLLRHRPRIPHRLRWRAILGGLLESGGYVCSVTALTRGPVSVASVMIGQFAVIAAVLGVVVLRERPHPRQIAGVCCTTAAVMLFALAA